MRQAQGASANAAATTPTSCPTSVLVVPEYWEQPHLQGDFEGGVGRGSTAGMVVVGTVLARDRASCIRLAELWWAVTSFRALLG